MDLSQILLLAMVAPPGLAFLGIALAWLLGASAGERPIIAVTKAAFGISGLSFLSLVTVLLSHGSFIASVSLGDWFRVHEYTFPLVFYVDSLSLPLAGLTILLTALVAVFSATYMHREAGFLRFYLQLNLFGCAALLVLTAGSFDLLIGGWELVGVSSVLLVAFFEQRTGPVRNAIRVFATYRTADIGLLTAVFFLHHWMKTASYPQLFDGRSFAEPEATLIGLLLLFAASGKSAQIPFAGWLPRAMEGPTPSSAIFYGAISVHLGAYLLLRARPILAESTLAAAVVILVGLLTALYGSTLARVCSDAKTNLAFAALSQLGLIFAEIGFGWTTLALFHILGHATVRTLQFLRAPSLLYDYHLLHSAAGGPLPKTAEHMNHWLPRGAQLWLYRFAIDRGHLDSLIDRSFVRRLTAVSLWIGAPASGVAGRPPLQRPRTKTVRELD